MFKEVFHFPAWNSTSGSCFLCNVTLATMRCYGQHASWKLPCNRLTHWQFLDRQMLLGRQVSAVYASPGFHTGLVAIDWLHCCDLGVCADFLGNIFVMLLPFYAGSNAKQRVSSMFLAMKTYYEANKISSRLCNLTLKMLKKTSKSSPKLRAKAAEARALVSFAKQEACKHLRDSEPPEQAAKMAACQLEVCYQCLSDYNRDTLEQASTSFCLLYEGLETYASAKGAWKIKPKFHMWLELCHMGLNPAINWVYRDEDFGGYAASVFRRRGGVKTLFKGSLNVLMKRTNHFCKDNADEG